MTKKINMLETLAVVMFLMSNLLVPVVLMGISLAVYGEKMTIPQIIVLFLACQITGKHLFKSMVEHAVVEHTK